MNSYLESYPYLEALIGGWFHQDFDLEGDTLEEILAGYRSSTSAEDVAGLHADVHRFLRNTGADRIDSELVERFSPGVLPSQWNLSTRDWLLTIDRLIA